MAGIPPMTTDKKVIIVTDGSHKDNVGAYCGFIFFERRQHKVSGVSYPTLNTRRY